MMEGFITKVQAGQFFVFSNGKIYSCRARGKFRIDDVTPYCGDEVIFDEKDLYLLEVKERKNCMVRPPIANVEQLVILASLHHPEISLALINRFMTMALVHGIKPILAISKLDLQKENDQMLSDIKAAYQNLDYRVIYFSNKSEECLAEVLALFKNKRTVLTGQSGVGKSSLINHLIPGYKQATAEISEALGRGKHVTRVSEYIPFSGGWVADTPGFSLFEISLTPNELATCYPGFENYFADCKFRNCLHNHEDDCAIKRAVKDGKISEVHYQAYLRLLDELQNKKERY